MQSDKNRVIIKEIKKLISSFKYAGQGIISSFLSERNMKIHIIIMLLVIIMGVVLKINKHEWITCVICFAIVISGELFNTAIETVVDIVLPYQDEKAKLAKDASAGAVLVLATGATIVGIIIFLPKLAEMLSIL
ncbi:MAG: diacylglycerol kinase family protein [Christensenellaceae bacterium]|nr:diacylglycerol kinase family protein [Christensenellaceae bacterium]